MDTVSPPHLRRYQLDVMICGSLQKMLLHFHQGSLNPWNVIFKLVPGEGFSLFIKNDISVFHFLKELHR